MMDRLFKIAADRHEGIKKEAILGAALRYVARNPLKTLGGVFTAQDMASSSKKMMGMAGHVPQVMPPPSITY